jgi:hypothetical protein
MAYIVTNKEYSLSFIAKDLDQLKSVYPGYEVYKSGEHGHLIEITNEDFVALQADEKFYYNEGSNWVIQNTRNKVGELPIQDPIILNEDQLNKEINLIVERLTNKLKLITSGTLHNEMKAYKTLLENLDKSTITYPINSTLEKYLKDQGQPIVSLLQI